MRLQRGVDLAEINRGRRGAQMLEQGGPQWTDRHPDFEALEVFGRQDRFAAAGDLAKADVPQLVEGVQVDLGDHTAQKSAELAVERRPYLAVVLERKPDS